MKKVSDKWTSLLLKSSLRRGNVHIIEKHQNQIFRGRGRN
jgi:hypothetical protein